MVPKEYAGSNITLFLPSLKTLRSNKKSKVDAWWGIKKLADDISVSLMKSKPVEDPVQISVEKDNISFGIGANIEITEQEANYLKKIRDLLGGGKMVITKGDLRIEVE